MTNREELIENALLAEKRAEWEAEHAAEIESLRTRIGQGDSAFAAAREDAIRARAALAEQGEPTDVQVLRAFPWAVENRVVRGPVIALFRTKEEAEGYADGFIDLRVRPVAEVRDLLS